MVANILTQANWKFFFPVFLHWQSTHSWDSIIRFHGIKSETSPKHSPASWEALFWKMHLLYAFLVLFSFSDGFDPNCPARCSCDSEPSVQCYRLTEAPSGIPSSTKKLYISHSKIQHLQVTAFFTLKLVQLILYGRVKGECGIVRLI